MSILPQRIDVMYLSLSVLTFRFFFLGGGGGGGTGRQSLPSGASFVSQYMYYLPQGGDVLLWIRKL